MAEKTPGRHQNLSPALFFLAAAVLLICAFFLWTALLPSPATGGEIAPEAERVLAAQADLPFQVLIPGFLPRQFKRAEVDIVNSGLRPGETPSIRLVYPTRDGNSLIIEQTPGGNDAQTSSLQVKLVDCRCQCQSGSSCQPGEMAFQIGSLKLTVHVSSPDMITMQELNMAMETMGPAANQQAYSNLESIPLSEVMPPPVEIEVNDQGVQEVTLVVTPDGYQPPHFAVHQNIPVRLIFRQVGYVSCGNELLFTWGKNDHADLVLESQNDKQVLEFTPQVAGEFSFNCPHYFYRGLMTVRAE